MAAPIARKPRAWAFTLFILFVVAYNLFRVALFAMTQTGAVKPDRPLDSLTNGVIVYSELAIGLIGLVAVPGLLGSKAWGFWGSIAVNAYAIVFDAVAAVAVQASAAGGVIPPLLILLGLIAFRHRFLKFPVRREAGAEVHA